MTDDNPSPLASIAYPEGMVALILAHGGEPTIIKTVEYPDGFMVGVRGGALYLVEAD